MPATLRKRSCVPDHVSCARPGPRERDRVLVEHGGAAAGEPLDRLEAAGARGVRRVGIAGAREVELAERDHRSGPREAKRLRQLAARDALEHRARDGGVEGGAVGERCADELESYRFPARRHIQNSSVRSFTSSGRSSAMKWPVSGMNSIVKSSANSSVGRLKNDFGIAKSSVPKRSFVGTVSRVFW